MNKDFRNSDEIKALYLGKLVESVHKQTSKKCMIFWEGLRKKVKFHAKGYLIIRKKVYYPFYWETPQNEYFLTVDKTIPFEYDELYLLIRYMKEFLKDCNSVVFEEFSVNIDRKDIPTARTRNEWEKLVRDFYGFQYWRADEYLKKYPWSENK